MSRCMVPGRFHRTLAVTGSLLPLLLAAPAARANWSWNLGYQNPAVSTLGVNFLYQGTQWGFETGIGWVDLRSTGDADESKDDNAADKDDDEDDGARLSLAGDIDAKYFFSGGGFRPFAQFGLGLGVGLAAGDQNGAGAGTGAPFAGLGLLFGKTSVYAYLSGNVSNSLDPFLQAGLGFDL